jgi:hypothetical protein
MPSKITEDTSGINRDLHKPARCAGAISMSGEDDADLQRKTEHFMEPPPGDRQLHNIYLRRKKQEQIAYDCLVIEVGAYGRDWQENTVRVPARPIGGGLSCDAGRRGRRLAVLTGPLRPFFPHLLKEGDEAFGAISAR